MVLHVAMGLRKDSARCVRDCCVGYVSVMNCIDVSDGGYIMKNSYRC